ncbi:MAG: YkgJ family cysteine cluster protein [Spirochaetales bacterium]|nr:YkgJ family cysteine cluster protein [Spirochaetales bacterium]
MLQFEGIGPRFRQTRTGKLLYDLDALYDELDDGIAVFQRENNLTCPQGCGICCSQFEPDVTEPEADFLAAYVMLYKPDLIKTIIENRSTKAGCFLFRETDPQHCPVYSGRPLICRMFAFTAVNDKQGKPRFSLCRHLPTAGSRHVNSEDMSKAFSIQPPVMQHYSSRVTGLANGLQESTPLRMALVRSLDKLRALAVYLTEDVLDGSTVQTDLLPEDSGIIPTRRHPNNRNRYF